MVSLYASVGAELTHYDLDVDAGTLSKRATIALPQDIHYAWPHASKKYLYVASSNGVPKGPPGTENHLTALKIAADGSLSPHGEAARLPTRPVHVCTDIPSTHALVAFTIPSALRVYSIKPDGTLGGEVAQAVGADAGIFAHQVRVTGDNRLAVLVTRGNDAANGKPEDPGALKVFKCSDGRLGDVATIAPKDGYGFGARHLDFHPSKPWVYVSIERQNQMMMFRREGDAIQPQPAYTKDLPQHPGGRSKQMGGTVHVHPKGHVVYGVNRAYTPVDIGGRMAVPGGENNIVVYRIDPATGEPTAIQHMDTRGLYCRTFHIDPSGRLLVAANIISLDYQDAGGAITRVPASLALFRIADDGRLEYLRKYDVDVGAKTMFWMGMV